MLDALQRHLTDIYRVERGYDVRDFLITDPRLARLIGNDTLLANTSETLLMAHDDDGLALSLFLDAGMLERLETADPLTRLQASQLADFWTVLEGISHFNCMVWKAAEDRAVSLLELEMQAEVDKFVSTVLLALEQGDGELMYRLHGWLFDEVAYRDDLDAEQLERYRAANEFAARFCRGLHRQLIDEDAGALAVLRQFYRLQLRDKISYIQSRTWGTA